MFLFVSIMRVPDEGYFVMFLFVSIMRVPDEGYFEGFYLFLL